jgi:hypothetical protein
MSRAERMDVRFRSQEIPMTDVATLGAVAPEPAHFPDSALYDFDFFCDSAYLADPHRRILELVNTAPPVPPTFHDGPVIGVDTLTLVWDL